MYRSLIAEAYNAENESLSAFRQEVQRRANLAGLDPATIMFLIRLAIWVYRLWKGLQLTEAPAQPVEGEPDYEREVRQMRASGQ